MCGLRPRILGCLDTTPSYNVLKKDSCTLTQLSQELLQYRNHHITLVVSFRYCCCQSGIQCTAFGPDAELQLTTIIANQPCELRVVKQGNSVPVKA